MTVDVVFTPTLLNAKELRGRTAVVIDVFRATTTILTALENGAAAVIPFDDAKKARAFAARQPSGELLLCGEQKTRKIKGFDLGNSPLEFTTDIVRDKTIALCTTNGTKALIAATSAAEVLVGCVRNYRAAAKRILKSGRDVTLVCSGSAGKVSGEDSLCAGLIVHALMKMRKKTQCTDAARMAAEIGERGEYLFTRWQNVIEHAVVLRQHSFTNDITFCLQSSVSYTVPVFQAGACKLV
jgi:2-phosphosulfolactate phosphatase